MGVSQDEKEKPPKSRNDSFQEAIRFLGRLGLSSQDTKNIGAWVRILKLQNNKATGYVAMLSHRCSSFLSKSNCRVALQFRQILYVVQFCVFFVIYLVFFRIHLKPSSHSGVSLPFDICLIYVYIIYLLTKVYFDLSLYFLCIPIIIFLFIFTCVVYIFSFCLHIFFYRQILHSYLNEQMASQFPISFFHAIVISIRGGQALPTTRPSQRPLGAAIIAPLSFRGQRWIKDGNRK